MPTDLKSEHGISYDFAGTPIGIEIVSILRHKLTF